MLTKSPKPFVTRTYKYVYIVTQAHPFQNHNSNSNLVANYPLT
jgi:hypothetical protein